jgi:hypothetical protein
MNLLRKYPEWEERRWLRRNLEWWERKRAKGRKRFVRGFVLLWGTLMIVGTSLTDYFVDDKFSTGGLIIGIPLYYLGGYFVGVVAWQSNEKRYRKFAGANTGVNAHVQ